MIFHGCFPAEPKFYKYVSNLIKFSAITGLFLIGNGPEMGHFLLKNLLLFDPEKTISLF